MRAAITGAATGIGAETVKKLKARGYEVTAFDIVEPKGVDHWIALDMSDLSAIEDAVAQVAAPFDCLINNAGLPPRDGLTKKILEVNYFGLVRLATLMEPKLKPGASIVNTASRAGAAWRENIEQIKALMSLDGPADLDWFIGETQIDHVRAYGLSKEAVIVWGIANTERLLARGLRVNSVSPAAVSTGILDDFGVAFGERMAKNIARSGRPGLPEEVADVIMYLISDQSAWVKGQDITMDGGMSAFATCDALELRAELGEPP
jgi:NAD(P)-dependent dehydrogenase (short-subunit alcohol dehydrogenase family)